MPRRTQTERTDRTTAALVAAARELFGRDGYAATGIDAVAAAGGVTKGAAYHHFQNKAALFRAVFVHEQRRISARLEQAAAAEPDSWSALLRGCLTFLEHCLDPTFRQVVLLDGPAVLGWETVREIEREHTLRVLTAGIGAAIADGRMAGGDPLVRAQLMFGALCEAGMLLARAGDPAGALPAVAAEAARLLGSVAAEPPENRPGGPPGSG
ncbi:TetR family transcriptional regulator [Sphaerisporangium rufum]|uniref:TetR family transcriptional regulator n=1 Tax=Sphaerisporangium rufum TaxID=1381558 RepID=A0A919UXE7_9ACTN|nr:TetR/AcrR family transcriptional regulator [Sphaerisporangium rufum]GII75764.1 TetR family transcriptional regulator [Sphaerisporangium rufum]